MSNRRQFLAAAAGAIAISAIPGRQFGRALAQATPTVDEVIAGLNLPELAVTQTAAGFKASAAQAEAGRLRLTVTPLAQQRVELSVIAFPAGMSADDANAAFSASYASDMPVEKAVYAGGVAVADGKPGWAIVDLPEGEWTLALTPSPLDGDQQQPPVSTLLPLAVKGAGAATAEAIPVAAAAKVTEFAFVGLKEASLPAGKQIWSIENTGAQPHHIVLFGTPKLVTDADVNDLLNMMMNATPTPPPDWFQQATEAGYVPVISPKQTMWTEFEFPAGFYLALCFIADPATGMPHVMSGMHQAFTVA